MESLILLAEQTAQLMSLSPHKRPYYQRGRRAENLILSTFELLVEINEKVMGERDLVTIVGSFANLQAGQTLKLVGFWRDHPKYGAQFQVTSYQETKPATLTGIEKYH